MRVGHWGPNKSHARQRTRHLVADHFERREPMLNGRLAGVHQRLAQGRQQARQGNRPAVLGPRLAIHPHPKLTAAGEGHACKLDFEIFAARIIFDRNSQVRFHRTMITGWVRKTNRAWDRACTPA